MSRTATPHPAVTSSGSEIQSLNALEILVRAGISQETEAPVGVSWTMQRVSEPSEVDRPPGSSTGFFASNQARIIITVSHGGSPENTSVGDRFTGSSFAPRSTNGSGIDLLG